MAQGQAVFRERTNRVTVVDPLVTMPELLPIVLDERFIDIAAGYLRSVPAVGSVTLRKSFVNDLPVFDTLYFHVDPNSVHFLKVFVYLHDVGPQGGPFTYVRGSHRERFRGWSTRRRWSEQEILAHYPAERIVAMTARAGDVVMADTTGFHRGTKPEAADRCMLTISYVLEPEYGGRYPRNAVRARDLERLTGKQRVAAALLDAR